MCKYFKENKKQTKAVHAARLLQTKGEEGRGLQQIICFSLSFCSVPRHRVSGAMKIFRPIWMLFDRGKCKGKEGEWFSTDLSKSLCDWNQLPRSSLAKENKSPSFLCCGYSIGSLSHIKSKHYLSKPLKG